MASDFEAALLAADIAAIRRCPKADLHTHGFAKADRAYVYEKTGRDIEPVQTPLASMDDMHAWVKTNLSGLFDGHPGRTLAIEANFVGALKDGVARIEFGDDVWMVTQGLGAPRDLVDSIARVRARAWLRISTGSRSSACRAIAPFQPCRSGWRPGSNWVFTGYWIFPAMNWRSP